VPVLAGLLAGRSAHLVRTTEFVDVLLQGPPVDLTDREDQAMRTEGCCPIASPIHSAADGQRAVFLFLALL
jgi:hypothetical protein